MRSFKLALKTSVIFLLILIVISTVITYPYFTRETYYYQDGHVRESMAGSLDLLICGASQSQRGISTYILDGELGCNSYNIATPLLTFRGRYYITKKEVERNDINTVIIELCYDTLARDRDEVDPEGEYYMLARILDPVERVKYFFSAARLDEYADFYYDSLQRGVYAWQHMETNAVGTGLNYDRKGYGPLESKPVEMIDEADYNKEEILTDFSEENLYFLDKIFELCLDDSIKVIVISTPLSDAAMLSYDKLDVIYDGYKAICDKWGCEYYDFSLYKGKSEILKDSDSFVDRNHLGTSGAEVFTPILAQVISDSAEGKTSYELFYDSYAEAQAEAIIPYHKGETEAD